MTLTESLTMALKERVDDDDMIDDGLGLRTSLLLPVTCGGGDV